MKIVCALKDHPFGDTEDTLGVVLYDGAATENRGSVGGAIKYQIVRDKLAPSARAWDFLSLALSVTTADLVGHRGESPDGWTREFELEVAVSDPAFWNGRRAFVNRLLGFLTTDKWQVGFLGGGIYPAPDRQPVRPTEDCVVLLSGGLDSLVGTIDLVASGRRPFAVSHTVRGDAENQRHFAQVIGGGLRHLQINHNAQVPDPETPPSQRARSLIFLACGVLAATTLERYHAGQAVTLYVCENGFISINPPLTDARIGSLSTRTTHPEFLGLVQELLSAAGLLVQIENPYQAKTKGEMLEECRDRDLLLANAIRSISCGRYKHFGYKHCGRCVPCLVRRAAFLKCKVEDKTEYIYEHLGRDDEDHASFDDVRSVAMAILKVHTGRIQDLVGTALSTAVLGDVQVLEAMVCRGLEELDSLLKAHGVK
jgi:7-cyano-7-deazaguanine synthase in queuosine biosynthesis